MNSDSSYSAHHSPSILDAPKYAEINAATSNRSFLYGLMLNLFYLLISLWLWQSARNKRFSNASVSATCSPDNGPNANVKSLSHQQDRAFQTRKFREVWSIPAIDGHWMVVCALFTGQAYPFPIWHPGWHSTSTSNWTAYFSLYLMDYPIDKNSRAKFIKTDFFYLKTHLASLYSW